MASVSDGPGPRSLPLGPGGEFDLIRTLTGSKDPASPHVLLGVGDDAAILRGGWAVSTDLAVEGVHFRRDWISLKEAGYRSTAGALSDLAAMASRPVGVLLSMALDPEGAREDALSLQEGAQEICAQTEVEIIGGDLARSPGPVFLSVTVVGHSEQPISRSGSQVGDEVWVTGQLGASGGATYLWDRGEEPPKELRQAYARPTPRIQEALWLAHRVSLHGLIDLSDGLAGDAGHLAAASGVALILREERIPIHPTLRSHPGFAGLDGSAERSLRLALQSGEDFELCLTVPPGTLDDWVRPFQDSFGVSLTRVGEVGEGWGVFLEGKEGGRLPLTGGFDHFSG